MKTQAEEQAEIEARMVQFRLGFVNGHAHAPMDPKASHDWINGYAEGSEAEPRAARHYLERLQNELRISRGPPITPDETVAITKRLRTLGKKDE